ncbi:MAG: 50S ribosomal protein L18 [Thermoplasmata archaeon]|nr:50S ribosomal protein L18 [Thermoplasmata archaeon]MCK4454986.1 50S ribosomal protein L18 [Thermoplasmata archaeon]
MVRGPRKRVAFRRRRKGRTDYRLRSRLLRSGLPRAVVRASNRSTVVQIMSFDPRGDRVLSSAVSSDLRKLGWEESTSNIPAAYLTGYLAGKRALENGIEEAVLDAGLHVPTKGSRIFASLKGMLDAGLRIPCGEEILPSDERVRGEHIGENTVKAFEAVKSKMEDGK